MVQVGQTPADFNISHYAVAAATVSIQLHNPPEPLCLLLPVLFIDIARSCMCPQRPTITAASTFALSAACLRASMYLQTDAE